MSSGYAPIARKTVNAPSDALESLAFSGRVTLSANQNDDDDDDDEEEYDKYARDVQKQPASNSVSFDASSQPFPQPPSSTSTSTLTQPLTATIPPIPEIIPAAAMSGRAIIVDYGPVPNEPDGKHL